MNLLIQISKRRKPGRVTVLPLIPLLALLFAFGCGHPKTTEHGDHDAHDHEEAEAQHEGTPEELLVTPEQLTAAGIRTGVIEQKNLSSSISVSGHLAVPAQNKALITSLSGGLLRRLDIQPGQHVRKGQVIGTIANTELAGMQQDLIGIEAQLVYAKQELSRQRELVAGNAAPLKNQQKAQAELNGLQARHLALKRQLEALGVQSSSPSATLELRAPISGSISEIRAQIGSSITAATPIAEIINNSELHLDLYVYERDLPQLAEGQRIHFTLTNAPGKEYDAEIFSIGTAFANETRAVPVHAHVVNDRRGLIEGMAVTARISIGETMSPAVPDAAIASHEGKDYIFMVHDDAARADKKLRFEPVQVVKGLSDLGYTEVRPLTMLPAGTRIAVSGAFYLMAMQTNSGGHEH